MSEYKYPAIIGTVKSGNEKILDNPEKTLLDFWKWAYSNVIGNAERGIFAEWLVSNAFGAANSTRVEWDAFDVHADNGLKIEVKTSGYIQSWGQNNLSEIKFGISKTHAWNYDTNTYDDETKRQADLYVFCVHSHKEQETADPLDISQWDFYVLSTDILNKKAADQKGISLSKLIEIGAVHCDYDNLKKTAYSVMKKINLKEFLI